MALNRTETTVRLKSDDMLYYTVALVDEGSEIIVPEADNTTGAPGTSDPYVALIGSDSQIYRWSLETLVVGETFVNNFIDLSPDQSEPALPGLDLLFGSQWLRVKVEVQPTAGGDSIPNLIVVDGQPWTRPVRRGGSAPFIQPVQLSVSFVSVSRNAAFRPRVNNLARSLTTSRTATLRRPNRTSAKY